MSDVVYRSCVRIERVKGPVRKAYLPAESEPVIFGVHGAVAEHYKVPASVRSHMQRRSTTSSLRPPVDSPEPLEVRWRRAKSMHQAGAW